MGKTIKDYLIGLNHIVHKKQALNGNAIFKSEINEFISEDYRTIQTTTSALQQLVSNSLSTMAGRKKRLRNLFWISKDRVDSNQLIFYDSTGSATNPVYILKKEDNTTQPFTIYKENLRGFFFSQSVYVEPRVLSLTNWIGIGFKLDPNEP